MKKRVLSGARPTGSLHLGNYFGAIKNWVELQDKYECFYMVADWHALMGEYANAEKITTWTHEMVADWIACGLDPNKSTIFVQSAVREHAELHLVLSCITPLGWLERSPTYKEQIKTLEHKDITNYAFLGYPVLQAADILLYKGDYVPVGEDQDSHLELSREIVRRFHHLFKCNIFPEPQSLHTSTPKVLGTDGQKKMSKSLDNYLACSEDQKVLQKKVLSMFTDPLRPRKEDKGHPENCNVFTFHNLFGNQGVEKIRKECKEAVLGCSDCKKELLGFIENFVAPIREHRESLLKTGEIRDIINEGNKKAIAVASSVMKEVKSAVFGKFAAK
ncbi:MAG: tryptophan--tRNA ligase [Planctomycetes bacterium]|nr:tryptophan--tRNA ligase [Planctomycetota bacterium]